MVDLEIKNAEWGKLYISTNPQGNPQFTTDISNGAGSGYMVHHLEVDGSTKINGTLTTNNLSVSGTKQFKIPHLILENKNLVHSCIESPRVDNLYRGIKQLINGKCEINIDTDCNENGD